MRSILIQLHIYTLFLTPGITVILILSCALSADFHSIIFYQINEEQRKLGIKLLSSFIPQELDCFIGTHRRFIDAF